MADKNSESGRRGYERHGMGVPKPPQREETVTSMQRKTSDALGLTPPMLELRFRTGDSKALAYSYLMSMDRNLSKGITLHFSTHTVDIQGRNLDRIHKGLLWQRLKCVVESDQGTIDQASDAAEVVSRISVTDVNS